MTCCDFARGCHSRPHRTCTAAQLRTKPGPQTPGRRPRAWPGALGLFLLLAGTAVAAQAADAPTPDLWSRNTLLGDMGGLRPVLDRHGVTVSLSETSEILGNASGGLRRGAAYDGVTQLGVQVDTAKTFGISGGTFYLSLLNIHGTNLAAQNLAALQGPSNIAANRSTRLWELWYQQSFPGDAMDVRLGQQSIDQEFMTSTYSALFLNSAMGWGELPAADLYAGGPVYPLSAPGVRLRAEPSRNVTVRAGVFDDNPPGGPFNDDSQVRGAERFGTRFSLDTGALIIGEIQYALNPPAAANESPAGPSSGLPGTYKIGFWYDTAAFPDQRFDTNGLSLANRASNGQPRADRGNYSFYAMADQMVWRPDPNRPEALGLFARAMIAPGDRNLVSFSADAGVTLKAPLPGRDEDSVGLGFGYARISPGARGFDRDDNTFSDDEGPVRHGESFIEATYQFQAAPWWQIQPDFQYVFSPGAGQNPQDTSKSIGDEAIFGLRTVVTF